MVAALKTRESALVVKALLFWVMGYSEGILCNVCFLYAAGVIL